MFGGLVHKLARAFGASDAPKEQGATALSSAPVTSPEQALDPLSTPSAATVEPWLDRTLPAEARLESYRSVIKAEGHDLLGRVEDKALSDEEFNRLENAPETQRIMRELEWLKTVTPTDFCKEMERREQLPRELLGKNFLGAEAWRKQGIDAGVEPALPATITDELLNSACPLHPGEKIKDTHLLVLIPKTVNGEPYTALELDELCATRKGSGDKLIYDGADWATAWKEKDWARSPQVQSEWVLIPKSDPDPKKVPADKHFRSKDIAAQQNVHETHYPEYREVKTLELMTAVLLYDLTNKERLVPDYLRCEEPNVSGGRVCVGPFSVSGLGVRGGNDVSGFGSIGRALARKTT